jgi:MFS family permease
MVLRLDPAQHTVVLAILATLVSCCVVLVPPFAGVLSDRARKRGGDRRVEVAVALGIDAVALVAMGFSATVLQLGIGLVVSMAALTAASTVYQAVLPEIVPRTAWGFASGVRGAMTLFGTIAGLATAALLSPIPALIATAAIVVITAFSLLTIPNVAPTLRQAQGDNDRKAHAVIRDRHDLIVTMFARAFIVLGMTLLNTYVLYFFNDILHAQNASLNTGFFAGCALVGAIASSIWAGTVSDRVDRRWIVAASGVPMTLAALGFALFPTASGILIYAVLFGLGFGGVFSVGWALALDAIPELGDVARDLGIWATLSSIPSIFAPPLGAFFIQHAPTPALGYRIMFAVAAFAFAAGSSIVLLVRKRVQPVAVPA